MYDKQKLLFVQLKFIIIFRMGNQEIQKIVYQSINRQNIVSYQSIIKGQIKQIKNKTIIQISCNENQLNYWKEQLSNVRYKIEKQHPITSVHSDEAFLFPQNIEYIKQQQDKRLLNNKVAILQFQSQLLSLAKSKEVHQVSNVPYTASALWNIIFSLVQILYNYAQKQPINLTLDTIFIDFEAKVIKIFPYLLSTITLSSKNQNSAYYDNQKLKLLSKKSSIPGYIQKANIDFNLGMLLCELMLLQDCSTIYLRKDNAQFQRNIDEMIHIQFMKRIMMLPYYSIKLKIIIIGLMNLNCTDRFTIQEVYQFLKQYKIKIKHLEDIHFSKTKMYKIFGKKMNFIEVLIKQIKSQDKNKIFKVGLPIWDYKQTRLQIQNIIIDKASTQQAYEQNIRLSNSIMLSLTQKAKTYSSLAFSKSEFENIDQKQSHKQKVRQVDRQKDKQKDSIQVKLIQTPPDRQKNQIIIQDDHSESLQSNAQLQLQQPKPLKKHSETILIKKIYQKQSSNKSLGVKSLKIYEHNKDNNYLQDILLNKGQDIDSTQEKQKVKEDQPYMPKVQLFTKTQQDVNIKNRECLPQIHEGDRQSMSAIKQISQQNQSKIGSYIKETPSVSQSPNFKIKKIQSRTYYQQQPNKYSPVYNMRQEQSTPNQSSIKQTNQQSTYKKNNIQSKFSIIDKLNNQRSSVKAMDNQGEQIQGTSNLDDDNSQIKELNYAYSTQSAKRKLQYLQTFSKFSPQLIDSLHLPKGLPPTHQMKLNSQIRMKKFEQMLNISRSLYPQSTSTPPRTQKKFAQKYKELQQKLT